MAVTEISVAKTEILTKERVARQDLGNRASPIVRAHMKKP